MDNESNDKITILFVDDDYAILNTIKRTFRIHQAFKIHTAQTISEAWEILKNNHVDILVSDYLIPELTGIEFAKRVQEQYPLLIIFILTGHSGFKLLYDELAGINISGVISKPWNDKELFQIFTDAYISHKRKTIPINTQ